jgi:hypothetical protein
MEHLEHPEVEVLQKKDINGRFMVMCKICKIYAHAYKEKEALEDLSNCRCCPDCINCNNLDNSFKESPAVPEYGDRNDILHICPNCEARWWQMNNHFHLWQRVTSDEEWESLKNSHPGYI